MVLLAAAFSLRFFRFGGVQKMVLGGVAAGFLLYVLSKVTEDLSKAELLHAGDRGMAARRDRRPDGVCRAAVPGGRVMAGAATTRRVLVAYGASQQSAADPVERGDDRCRRLAATLRRRRPQRSCFPTRPLAKQPKPSTPQPAGRKAQMLVQATEMQLRLHQQARLGGRQRPDLLRRLDASKPTRSSTTRRPSGCAPKATSG